MIVKIKSGKNAWSYFEGDNIVQKEIDLSNTDANGYVDTLFFLREGTKMNIAQSLCKCGKSHSMGVLLCIQKENRVIARIIVNRSTYVMNDLGKTIDKLI